MNEPSTSDGIRSCEYQTGIALTSSPLKDVKLSEHLSICLEAFASRFNSITDSR